MLLHVFINKSASNVVMFLQSNFKSIVGKPDNLRLQQRKSNLQPALLTKCISIVSEPFSLIWMLWLAQLLK